ncbi:Surfactin synthase subunit 2 [compost metagenome]
MEGHGREALTADVDVSRTVGWFTSVYPVVLDMSNAEHTGAYLKATKEYLRKIPNKGVGYGIWRYMTQQRAHRLAEPEIMFNYLGQFDQDFRTSVFEQSDWSTGAWASAESERSYKLEISCMIRERQFEFAVKYDRREYGKQEMDAFARDFAFCLLELIEHCLSQEHSEMTPGDTDFKELTLEEFDHIADFIDQIEIE